MSVFKRILLIILIPVFIELLGMGIQALVLSCVSESTASRIRSSVFYKLQKDAGFLGSNYWTPPLKELLSIQNDEQKTTTPGPLIP